MSSTTPTNSLVPSSSSSSPLPVLVLEERETYWGIADRDVPILIGAAAGAFGLVFLILGAFVIWYCCQYVFRRDKSLYSLEIESERGSVSSNGSLRVPFSDAVLFMGKKSGTNPGSGVMGGLDHESTIRRSLSAPMNVYKGALVQNGRQATAFPNKLYQYVEPNQTTLTYERSKMAPSDRSKLYAAIAIETIATINENDNSLSDKLAVISETSTGSGTTSVALSMKSRSLPWKHSQQNATLDDIDSNDEDDDQGSLADLSNKVNFSKNRKNRMRSDSAAAIAVNKSGFRLPLTLIRNHNDTDSLVDNEAVVVYNERTAL
ncbi:hypothetical protein HDE_07987 [Halotydeus destructor]|nr:hypothetical protein HDE_07987 [Halotydeus destructor]